VSAAAPDDLLGVVSVPFFEHDGEDLYYEDAGSGPAVVLLHSLGTWSGIWAGEVERLRGRFRCLAPDARGHGRSSARGPITRDAIVADIVALLDRVGADAAHVVGLSMGGCWALRLWDLHPGRVLSLALCDTFASVPDPVGPVRSRREQLEKMSMQEYARQYAATTLQPGAAPDVVAGLERAVAGMSRRALLETAEACFTTQLDHVLPTVRVPTLVLIGDRDERTPLPLSERLADGIPGARLVVVSGAGHLSNLDNPREFDAALEAHLAAAAGA
jgi:3-oxoadipate enol-lactonase